MEFNIIYEKSVWDSRFSDISPVNKDIYFSFDYCHLYEVNGDGLARAAFFKGDNGAVILYPFILKIIKGYKNSEACFDIESAYGYGGPLIENYNAEDVLAFENSFHKWCIENRVVAEFVRFHPLLENHRYFNLEIKKEENRTTVFVDLTTAIDDIWSESIKSENRSRIRKALKSGVTIRQSNDCETFADLYKSTMDRLEADRYYFFSKEYFKQLYGMDTGRFISLEAVFDGRVIAGGNFLIGPNYLHYHLGGSDKDYLNFAPNNLLLYRAIEIGCEMGLQKFHLGGGTTNDDDDSLFRFKRSFSKATSKFYIGKRIHDQEKYSYFMSEWKKKFKLEPRLFLQYEFGGDTNEDI